MTVSEAVVEVALVSVSVGPHQPPFTLANAALRLTVVVPLLCFARMRAAEYVRVDET